MSPLKAPGPDGFSAGFYQEIWETVGDEVCKVIIAALHSGLLHSDFNFTYLALIPNIQNPSKVSEFRPISLCNVSYKILSKVLANRLKIVLPDVISSS